MILTERKISLPAYKLAYAFSFVVILSLIRGISFSYEIGVAMEAPMAILAMVFCADTYTQEITSKRSEIHRLYPMKRRLFSIGMRMVLQEIALFVLSAVGYGLFYGFQHPQSLYKSGQSTESELQMFFIFLAAMVVTLWFWGILSNLLACLFRNMWVGIGCGIALWLGTNSIWGDNVLGNWNLFSYAFRNVMDSHDFGWLYGKVSGLLLCVLMTLLMPKIIKKRG